MNSHYLNGFRDRNSNIITSDMTVIQDGFRVQPHAPEKKKKN